MAQTVKSSLLFQFLSLFFPNCSFFRLHHCQRLSQRELSAVVVSPGFIETCRIWFFISSSQWYDFLNEQWLIWMFSIWCWEFGSRDRTHRAFYNSLTKTKSWNLSCQINALYSYSQWTYCTVKVTHRPRDSSVCLWDGSVLDVWLITCWGWKLTVPAGVTASSHNSSWSKHRQQTGQVHYTHCRNSIPVLIKSTSDNIKSDTFCVGNINMDHILQGEIVGFHWTNITADVKLPDNRGNHRTDVVFGPKQNVLEQTTVTTVCHYHILSVAQILEEAWGGSVHRYLLTVKPNSADKLNGCEKIYLPLRTEKDQTNRLSILKI